MQPAPVTSADILPGYQFAADIGRYRSNVTGRFVARNNVLDLLRTQIDTGRTQLAGITRAYHEGRLSGSVWMEESRTILRRMHLQNSALGSGGFDRLGPREFGRVGGRIRQDYAALQRLHEAVQSGDATLPQALQRVNGMAGNARVNFWDAERDHSRRSASNRVVIERNILGVGAEHCQDCIELYERGWQLENVIPSPGTDRQCGTNCQCTIERREVEASEANEWIGSKR